MTPLLISAALVFQCSIREIDTKTEKEETITFQQEAGECAPGDTCFIPIRQLKTKLACRDFTVAVDRMGAEPSLDVTLWAYCGAKPDKGPRLSQTVSVSAETRFFHLVAEWGRFMNVVDCRR